jgi:hypothetical protein
MSLLLPGSFLKTQAAEGAYSVEVTTALYGARRDRGSDARARRRLPYPSAIVRRATGEDKTMDVLSWP